MQFLSVKVSFGSKIYDILDRKILKIQKLKVLQINAENRSKIKPDRGLTTNIGSADLMDENGSQECVTSSDYGEAEPHGFPVLVFVLGDLNGGVSSGRDLAGGWRVSPCWGTTTTSATSG